MSQSPPSQPSPSELPGDREHPAGDPPEQASSTPNEAPVRAGNSADAADSPPVLWLRRGDQLVVGVLVVTALALMLVHWVRLSGWGVKPVEIERQPNRWARYLIDINEAGWVEWAQLQGIGETLARRIVADRERNGPFRTIDDLQRVKGIGPKTVERIRPWLRRRERPAHGADRPK